MKQAVQFAHDTCSDFAVDYTDDELDEFEATCQLLLGEMEKKIREIGVPIAKLKIYL